MKDVWFVSFNVLMSVFFTGEPSNCCTWGVFFMRNAMRYVNVKLCGNRSLSVDLVGSGSFTFLGRGIDSLFEGYYGL